MKNITTRESKSAITTNVDDKEMDEKGMNEKGTNEREMNSEDALIIARDAVVYENLNLTIFRGLSGEEIDFQLKDIRRAIVCVTAITSEEGYGGIGTANGEMLTSVAVASTPTKETDNVDSKVDNYSIKVDSKVDSKVDGKVDSKVGNKVDSKIDNAKVINTNDLSDRLKSDPDYVWLGTAANLAAANLASSFQNSFLTRNWFLDLNRLKEVLFETSKTVREQFPSPFFFHFVREISGAGSYPDSYLDRYDLDFPRPNVGVFPNGETRFSEVSPKKSYLTDSFSPTSFLALTPTSFLRSSDSSQYPFMEVDGANHTDSILREVTLCENDAKNDAKNDARTKDAISTKHPAQTPLVSAQKVSLTFYLCATLVPKIQIRSAYGKAITQEHLISRNKTNNAADDVPFDGNTGEDPPVSEISVNSIEGAIMESLHAVDGRTLLRRIQSYKSYMEKRGKNMESNLENVGLDGLSGFAINAADVIENVFSNIEVDGADVGVDAADIGGKLEETYEQWIKAN